MDYNKLLEKARKVYAECVTCAEKRRLESIFPELKKMSEDEIVISALKSGIKVLESEYKIEGLGGLYFKKILAWLEKQGEQKPANKPKFKVGDRVNKNDREDEEYNIITITSVNVDEHCYICNQCSVIDFEEQDLWHIVEQKPAWSEDDEQYCRYIIDFYLQKSYGATAMAIEWLENLKNRVQPQPKQEWSEEDEIMINDIILDIQYTSGSCERNIISDKKIAWLKSLKPQPHWKPTKEQVDAFREIMLNVTKYKSDDFKLAESLYNELKKL